MADQDEGETETSLGTKTLGGKICSVFNSRFTWIVVVYMEVLLTQYVLLSYLSPFFPTVANGLGLSDFSSGLIFAGYPIGAVITGPFTAKVIEKIGGKATIAGGLILAGIFTMLFGLTKDTFHLESPNHQYFFFTFALLYGGGSALAETGIMIVIENVCPENMLARVLAMGEMTIGVACTIGPLIGGAMFADAGLNCQHTREGFVADADILFVNETHKNEEEDGCWLSTFTTMSSMALVSAIFVVIVIPGKTEEDDADSDDEDDGRDQSLLGDSRPATFEYVEEEEKTYLQLLIEYKVFPPAIVFMFSTICFSALTPVLALKLSDSKVPPFNMDSMGIGLVWLVSSAFYMVVALGLGFYVDSLEEGSFKKHTVLQLAGACSMFLMFAGWFCAGPAQMPFTPEIEYNASSAVAVDLVTAMDQKISWVILSQILLGIGSAMYTIPSLPALLFFIPEENEDGDENPHRSFATGFWVTIYCASVAIGNTIGSELYGSIGMRRMSGFMMIWCMFTFICYLVWIGYALRHFRTERTQKKLETPKTVNMSEMANSYEAPSLPSTADDESFDTNAEFGI